MATVPPLSGLTAGSCGHRGIRSTFCFGWRVASVCGFPGWSWLRVSHTAGSTVSDDLTERAHVAAGRRPLFLAGQKKVTAAVSHNLISEAPSALPCSTGHMADPGAVWEGTPGHRTRGHPRSPPQVAAAVQVSPGYMFVTKMPRVHSKQVDGHT